MSFVLGPNCRHIQPTGKRCGSPALRGEPFCYFHHPTRRPQRRPVARPAAFTLPPITCHEDVQIALSEVISRLANNTLDIKRATMIMDSLRMAQANLRSWSGPS